MKKLFIVSLFLLFSCKIMAQSDFRIMGGGIMSIYDNGNKQVNQNFFTPLVFKKTDIAISYYYNSFHQIKNSPIYITTSSKIFYSVREQIFNGNQRIGIGFKNKGERSKTTYYNIGGEFNLIGFGIYGNANILFKGKKNYFAISPEINVIKYDYYDYNPNWKENLLFIVGCNIGMGWNKKEFIPKPNKNYAAMNYFNANISIGYFNNLNNERAYINKKTEYIDINAAYRILHKQIISPEVGLGLLVCKGNTNLDIQTNYPYFPIRYFGNYIPYYAQYTDIIPYIKAGFDIQTRRKVAFIGYAGMYSSINIGTFGSQASIGIKYAISNKIATSLSIESQNYIGNAYGHYTGFRKNSDNEPYKIEYDIKGLHNTSSYGNLYGIKMGVHF